ncbi:MAG: efflux RND transporter periplasmic adaptor subunit [Deltaproteobacteria bacterium]|nr:efflux RND transporter periplasmic adaptor subunit [Deltaproteobacteria bacterium]
MSQSSAPACWRGLLVAALAVGCGANEYAPPPPPTVTTMHPQIRDVTNYVEYTGTTRAVETVEVLARVKGFLLEMYFKAGENVAKGDPLFLIDPEPFEITLEAANAELSSSQAELELAKIEFDRTRQMFKRGATSELDLIRKRANRDKATAAVAAAQADTHSAELDLDYAHVTAPIAGRVGRHLVDMGNLVGVEEATRLTDMLQYSPLYVYFHISERDLLALQDQRAAERIELGQTYDERPAASLEVGRANEAGYPHVGQIDFTALEIDPDTGTFEVRGILPNEGEFDQIIFPGTFVRVRVPIGVRKGALLIPENALGADQSGRYALVVNSKDVVEHRRLELGARLGDLRVITAGLRREDRVIVNGLQRARPGAKVNPEEAQPTPPSGASTARTTQGSE